MTTQIGYAAHNARFEEFRRQADEHRRAAGRQRRGRRLGVMVRHRARRGAGTRSPAPVA